MLENCRVVPCTTAVAAVTALCGVYALFFAVQAGEWLAAAPLGLDAPDTAAFAVNGFWELLKILLLDFSVLAGIQFFGRAPLPKALAAVFCGFGVAFAALAAGKLAVYVTLCALTPRRFTGGRHGSMVPVCAGCLCGAGAGAGVQADPGGEACHFCGSGQLYTALLRECKAAGHGCEFGTV